MRNKTWTVFQSRQRLCEQADTTRVETYHCPLEATSVNAAEPISTSYQVKILTIAANHEVVQQLFGAGRFSAEAHVSRGR